jgi:hypothetical protein
MMTIAILSERCTIGALRGHAKLEAGGEELHKVEIEEEFEYAESDRA